MEKITILEGGEMKELQKNKTIIQRAEQLLFSQTFDIIRFEEQTTSWGETRRVGTVQAKSLPCRLQYATKQSQNMDGLLLEEKGQGILLYDCEVTIQKGDQVIVWVTPEKSVSFWAIGEPSIYWAHNEISLATAKED